MCLCADKGTIDDVRRRLPAKCKIIGIPCEGIIGTYKITKHRRLFTANASICGGETCPRLRMCPHDVVRSIVDQRLASDFESGSPTSDSAKRKLYSYPKPKHTFNRLASITSDSEFYWDLINRACRDCKVCEDAYELNFGPSCASLEFTVNMETIYSGNVSTPF